MFGLGIQEFLTILVLVFLVLGPRSLAQIGGSLGKAIGGFERGIASDQASEFSSTNDSDTKKT